MSDDLDLIVDVLKVDTALAAAFLVGAVLFDCGLVLSGLILLVVSGILMIPVTGFAIIGLVATWSDRK